MTQLTLLYNGNIITLDERHPKASAVAILGERILAVGQDQELLEKFRQAPFKTELMDLKGKTILPGLMDAHLHLLHFSLGLEKVNCETETLQACLDRVAERAQTLPVGEWILGHGWNQNHWAEGFGNAEILDQVAPNHPVYLTAKSLHAAWANSFALEKAGIQLHTPDPPGGKIGRHADGKPNGILFENAMQLVADVIPPPTPDQSRRAIEKAQQALIRLGVTAVHDFDGKACFSALQELHRESRLKIRVLKNLPAELMDEAIALGLHSGFGDDMLRLGSIKFFADGALGPRTAAMFEPYLEEPDQRGSLLLDAEALTELGKKAIQNGLSLAVHAIGDRANHEVLNAFQHMRQLENESLHSKHLRHRIEHVQLLHPQDVKRLAELNLIASMQPFHATSDMLMAQRYWGERCRYAYAWRTQLKYGSILAFGSDAPVEWPNPFWGIHAAVTRQRQDGSPSAQGWIQEEKITLIDALRAYTYGAAYAAYMENRLCKLAPLYYADLILLEEDPFEIPASELHTLAPLATMIGGQWVYTSFGE